MVVRGLVLGCWVAWWSVACGGDPQPRVDADTAPADAEVDAIDAEDGDADAVALDTLDVDSAEPDSAAPDTAERDSAPTDTTPPADTTEPPPLADADGLAAWVSGLALAPGESTPRAVWLEVETGLDRFPLHADPATPPLWRVPPAADGAPVLAAVTPWTLAPGAPVSLADDAPWLIASAPSVRALDLTLRAFARDPATGADTLLAEAPVHLVPGEGATVRQVMPEAAPVRVWIRAASGVAPLPPATALGLLLDSSRPGLADPVAAFVADLAGRPLRLKAYHGTRRLLLRPGCDSAAACAPGGPSFPCVSTCACTCETPEACDCDFSTLEAEMRSRALGAATRVFGADASPATLATARVHYVFKRSLGGTTSCDDNGEVDVTPATYAALFTAALDAAHRVNIALGYRLIDAVSPQNESNHPLQDGRHRNAAGHLTLGGEGVGVPFVDLIEQQSCSTSGCCTQERYLVADPDVPALLAASLVAGRAWHTAALAGPHAALAPEVGMSLYLDSDQTDPLATDAEGAHPAIVTPIPQFLDELAAALAATPGASAALADWASDLVFVDTYPGSWAAPWFITDDDVVHHFDPATEHAMRYEATRAADAVTARTAAAADAFEARFGLRPRYQLGEVGWSTFDQDFAAQARFARRLFMRVAELAAADPRFEGLIWFKDTDRVVGAYPRWVDAPDPLTGRVLPCNTWFLSRVACAAEILTAMEGSWGLFAFDGAGYAPKPAWPAWHEAFLAWVPAAAAP